MINSRCFGNRYDDKCFGHVIRILISSTAGCQLTVYFTVCVLPYDEAIASRMAVVITPRLDRRVAETEMSK